jgi:ribonuclease P protein component
VTSELSASLSPRSRGFPKSARVLRTSEFRTIYDTGVRLSGPLFAAFVLARPQGPDTGKGARLGLTVPRAVGDAVQRNRIKRRLRELFRHRRERLGDFDIVLNPRRAFLTASIADIEKAFDKLMQRTEMERIR